jgi:hypothetical protein
MRIQIESKAYELVFAHHLQGGAPGTQATEARLETVDPSEVVATGYAICARGDQYDKSKGRKIALTRLLKGVSFTHRKAVWTQYWEGIGKGHFNAPTA